MANEKDRDADDHFTGQGECSIHTSRSHTKCSTAESGCNHQTNCTPRPATPWMAEGAAWVWDDEWESHHVVCVSCVNKYMVLKAHEKTKATIDAVYREAKWCINQQPNLIALPMRKVYSEHATSRELNLPCHDWDHNITGGYTDEVTQEIHLKVWQPISERFGKEKTCDLAKSAVQEQLDSLSKFFRKELEDRGRRFKAGEQIGTLAAWNESQKNDPAKRANDWWFPFSMAKDSVAASRPVQTFGAPKWSSAEERYKLRLALNVVREKA